MAGDDPCSFVSSFLNLTAHLFISKNLELEKYLPDYLTLFQFLTVRGSWWDKFFLEQNLIPLSSQV